MSRTVSDDAIFHGNLRLRQHERGYRFSEDAVLLAAFASGGPKARIVADFGAGSGIVGLILLHHKQVELSLALEIQPALARLCFENSCINDFRGRMLTLRSDLRRAPLASHSVDLVVSNPPYMPYGIGHLPPDSEKALARHELCCSPETLASEAARCLVPEGRLALIYPYQRLKQVMSAVKVVGLAPTRIKLVRPGPDREPVLFLLESQTSRPGIELCEEPPMVTRDRDGRHSSEMTALLCGRVPGADDRSC